MKYFVDELGFNPTETGSRNYTLLHFAVLGGHLPLVQYLLQDKEVEPLCYADKGLHFACFLGESNLVMELMQNMSTYMHGQGSNLSSATIENVTPLHLAAARGCLSIVKYLILDKKCDLTCRDRCGWQHACPSMQPLQMVSSK